MDDGWTRLLAAARSKLERTGTLDGSIGLTDPSDAERRVVIGITGTYRPETVKRLRVPLADLDAALRHRHGKGLPEFLGPIRNRPTEHARLAAERDRLIADATGAGAPADWLTGLTQDGTLTRLVRRGDGHLLGQAVAVLTALPADGLPLPVLAERVTGDTKALAPGTPLATLVLRALTPEVPSGRVAQRAVWESAGVILDDLSSHVLVLNLPVRGTGPVANWLAEAQAYGIPFRLTLQQLTVSPVTPTGEIFVCENPAVLRSAAAELGSRCPPVVCTEGMPSAACHRLMSMAEEVPRWRADFDWTGLRIVAAAAVRYGATPWRMSAADYNAASALGESTPLTGHPAPSPWDPALSAALAGSGRAVMEERLVPQLIDDLRP